MSMHERLLNRLTAIINVVRHPAKTERRRFVLVIALWAISILLINSYLAAAIGLVALLAYWRYFVDFVREALRNKWPYNFLAALGGVIVYFLTTWVAVAFNIFISEITGFHPTQFPSAVATFSAIGLLFSVVFAFTIISGLTAIVTGFSSGIANRIFPIAFMVSFPILNLFTFIGNGSNPILLTERIILSVSFNRNSSFESGTYSAKDGVRSYGTKLCSKLPFDALLAPFADGGYIVATERGKPATFEFPLFPRSEPVMTTHYTYSFIEQKDCPVINEYIEIPHNQ
jgi:hypothetical protein